MIVYNTTEEIIFITVFKNLGCGEFINSQECSISPGEGIELDMVGLKTKESVRRRKPRLRLLKGKKK